MDSKPPYLWVKLLPGTVNNKEIKLVKWVEKPGDPSPSPFSRRTATVRRREKASLPAFQGPGTTTTRSNFCTACFCRCHMYGCIHIYRYHIATLTHQNQTSCPHCSGARDLNEQNTRDLFWPGSLLLANFLSSLLQCLLQRAHQTFPRKTFLPHITLLRCV